MSHMGPGTKISSLLYHRDQCPGPLLDLCWACPNTAATGFLYSHFWSSDCGQGAIYCYTGHTVYTNIHYQWFNHLLTLVYKTSQCFVILVSPLVGYPPWERDVAYCMLFAPCLLVA